MKGIKKQVNPHTYWPREVIWLFIVYLYDRFISILFLNVIKTTKIFIFIISVYLT